MSCSMNTENQKSRLNNNNHEKRDRELGYRRCVQGIEDTTGRTWMIVKRWLSGAENSERRPDQDSSAAIDTDRVT